jgi:undecaprenyl-diphosphatase
LLAPYRENLFVSILEAIVLGIVQGLTEFLPVSSTAHLRIVPALVGWEDAGSAFTAIIQLGTLVAVMWYFRHELRDVVAAFFSETLRGKFGQSPAGKLGLLMIFGTIPIVIIGLALKKHIKGEWRNLWVVAGAMIGLAIVLTFAELYTKWRVANGKEQRELEKAGYLDAVLVGLAQCVALVPGASRSGTTITGALFCGFERGAAARFSFLLSLPAVFAAAVHEMLDLVKDREQLQAIKSGTAAYGFTELAIATVVSGIVGYGAIVFLMNYLKTHTTYWFVAYRIVAGLLLIWALKQNYIAPGL